MIRLPMLNVDSWFVGVRDGDEWAAQSAAPNAQLFASSAEVYSARRSRVVTGGAIESICLNQEAVGTKPSSAIPKRSTSDDVEECRVGTNEMFRTYASLRVLSTANRISTIAFLPTQAERRRGQRPQAVRHARSKRSGER